MWLVFAIFFTTLFWFFLSQANRTAYESAKLASVLCDQTVYCPRCGSPDLRVKTVGNGAGCSVVYCNECNAELDGRFLKNCSRKEKNEY